MDMKQRLRFATGRSRIAAANFILRKRVRRLDFTIVSVDCWGSSIYQDLGIPYNTPFVGLFFYAPCFLKLLRSFEKYMRSDLSFTDKSHYPEANQSRDKSSNYYPIGKLGDDVEVHFLHYKDEETARKKWYSRRERINMNNLFVEFSDRNLCKKSHLLEFDRLDFRNKVVFTAQYHPDIKSSVWLNEYVSEQYIKNIYVNRAIYKRHFDVADWLNGGSGRVNSFLKILNNVLEEEEWWKFADVETLKRFKLTE